MLLMLGLGAAVVGFLLLIGSIALFVYLRRVPAPGVVAGQGSGWEVPPPAGWAQHPTAGWNEGVPGWGAAGGTGMGWFPGQRDMPEPGWGGGSLSGWEQPPGALPGWGQEPPEPGWDGDEGDASTRFWPGRS